MNDVNKFTDDNLGGVMLFKFIPVDDVSSIPTAVNHIIPTGVVLKPGCRWYEFYGTIGTIEFTEKKQDSEAGAFYKKSLKAITPKVRTELDLVFNEMKNRRFILDVTDNNGIRKIVGSIEAGLKFSDESNTKSEASQRNEYSIEFSGEGEDKSYTYNV